MAAAAVAAAPSPAAVFVCSSFFSRRRRFGFGHPERQRSQRRARERGRAQDRRRVLRRGRRARGVAVGGLEHDVQEAVHVRGAADDRAPGGGVPVPGAQFFSRRSRNRLPPVVERLRVPQKSRGVVVRILRRPTLQRELRGVFPSSCRGPVGAERPVFVPLEDSPRRLVGADALEAHRRARHRVRELPLRRVRDDREPVYALGDARGAEEDDPIVVDDVERVAFTEPQRRVRGDERVAPIVPPALQPRRARVGPAHRAHQLGIERVRGVRVRTQSALQARRETSDRLPRRDADAFVGSESVVSERCLERRRVVVSGAERAHAGVARSWVGAPRDPREAPVGGELQTRLQGPVRGQARSRAPARRWWGFVRERGGGGGVVSSAARARGASPGVGTPGGRRRRSRARASGSRLRRELDAADALDGARAPPRGAGRGVRRLLARARDVAERQHAARERAARGAGAIVAGAAAPAIEAPGAEPAPASAARLRSFSARRIGRRARGGEEPAGGASAARFRPGEDAIREAGTRPGRAVQNNERERSER